MKSISTVIMLSASAALMGAVSPNAYAEPAPEIAADCAVLGQVADNAIGTLTPLQSMPVEEGQAARDRYVAELQAQRASLGTEQGRADLDRYIDAVQGATSADAAQSIIGAIGKIRTDCS